MEASEIIKIINQRKAAMGLTLQQLSDMSGVPKATVEKVLSGKTPNPTLQTVLDLSGAVGYDHTASSNPMDDPAVKHLLALYNRQLAEKQRIIVVLGAILGILILFICCLFLYDFAHLDRGWIQT